METLVDELVAILFVVDEKGHRLVFWYPPNPQPTHFNQSKYEESIPPLESGSIPLLGFERNFLADLLTPKTKLCNKKFLLTIDDLTFVGHPTLLTPENNSQKLFKADFINESSMNLFNVVFVLQSMTKKTAHALHEHVIFKLSSALKHEQLRANYLGQETEVIIAIQEKTVFTTETPEQKEQMLINEILKSSHLARDLKGIFENLRDINCAHVKVNDWIYLSLSIPDKIPPFPFPLRIYHTILLLEDSTTLIKQLPIDASPLLVKLIQVANPAKSFQDLQKELCCSFAQLLRLASNLVHYRKAIIISQLRSTNVYVIQKDFKVQLDSPLSKEFSSQFPYTNIFDVLGLFSTPIPFGDILPETNKNNFVDILIWLLRKDVLVQLHDYVYLLESSLAKERLLSRSFSKASDSELELIDQLTQGKPATLANLFRRLYPYFNGKFHIEEIIWREGITRSDVYSLISKFPNDLVICRHE